LITGKNKEYCRYIFINENQVPGEGCYDKTAVAYHPLAVWRRPNLWKMFLSGMAFVAERYQKYG
jgi:hypothetical protein